MTEELLRIGQQMSNACYNLAQKPEFTEEDRKILLKLASEWDKHDLTQTSPRTYSQR